MSNNFFISILALKRYLLKNRMKTGENINRKKKIMYVIRFLFLYFILNCFSLLYSYYFISLKLKISTFKKESPFHIYIYWDVNTGRKAKNYGQTRRNWRHCTRKLNISFVQWPFKFSGLCISKRFQISSKLVLQEQTSASQTVRRISRF